MLARKKTTLSILVFMVFVFCCKNALCSQVSGKIRTSGARNVQILVKIPTPAPKTIILTLKLPAGVSVASANPAPSRLLSDKQEVNWLLSDLGPGERKIECRMDRNVKISDLRVSVRYKNPRTGKMEEHALGE